MSAVIFVTLIVLIALDMPVVFALGLAALAAVVFSGDLPLTVVPQRVVVGLDSFPLLAAPLFIFAGEIMSSGAMSDRLVKFTSSLLGHIRGSLAMIMVLVSMLFAGVSGSATADTAAVGSILIPAMIRRGYAPSFATALQACAGCIGPIIPPSVVMVIYGWVAGVSVGALFLGGVVPGVLIGLGLMAIAYFNVQKGGSLDVGRERASAAEIRQAGIGALPALGMPVIILGGILGGIFTATEAAAVAVVYALAVELIVYRDISIAGLPSLLVTSVVRSTVVMMIVAMAALLGWMITYSGLPDQVGRMLSAISPNKYVLLLWLNILFLIIGTFMEAYAAIILMIPILLPVINAYDINLIHFGVVVTVNLCIGMVTPPLGVTLFVASSISGQSISSVLRPLGPMLLTMVAVLLLITYLPATIMWLPQLFH